MKNMLKGFFKIISWIWVSLLFQDNFNLFYVVSYL